MERETGLHWRVICAVRHLRFDGVGGSGGNPRNPLYAKHPKTTSNYWADLGCLFSGTANNKSGNAMNYPDTIGPDSHVDGSALPVSTYEADVGYLIDSTAINAAGNIPSGSLCQGGKWTDRLCLLLSMPRMLVILSMATL
jgi:hypothetical protein